MKSTQEETQAGGILGIIALALAVGLATPVSVRAQTLYPENEVALLPTYCQTNRMVSGKFNPAEVKRWTAIMGSLYDTIHHYCWGLIATNRAKLFSKSKPERLRNLAASIPEFDYVIRNSSREFVLLPEILTRKGENLLGVGRTAEGIQALQQAIEIKPDYWPPYTILSDHLKEKGDKAKAREWLEKALTFSPDARAVQTRLAELGATGATRKPAAKAGEPSARPAPASPQRDAGKKPESAPADGPPPPER